MAEPVLLRLAHIELLTEFLFKRDKRRYRISAEGSQAFRIQEFIRIILKYFNKALVALRDGKVVVYYDYAVRDS